MTNIFKVSCNHHGVLRNQVMYDQPSAETVDGGAWIGFYNFENTADIRFPLFRRTWWGRLNYSEYELVWTTFHKRVMSRLQLVQPTFGMHGEIELLDH